MARRLLPQRKLPISGAGESLRHVEPEQAKRGGHDARGAPLLEGQFGVCMQVAPQRDQRGQEVVDRVVGLQRHEGSMNGNDGAA